MSARHKPSSMTWMYWPALLTSPMLAWRRSLASLQAISRVSKKPWLCTMCVVAMQTNIVSGEELDHLKVNPVAGVRFDRLDGTLQRPLFSSARRRPAPAVVPVVAQQAEAPPPPPPPPNLTLLGVMTEWQGRLAIIQPDAPEKIRMVKIGDEIGGWKVSVIEPRKLILAQEDRSSTFSLFKAPAPVGRQNRRSR